MSNSLHENKLIDGFAISIFEYNGSTLDVSLNKLIDGGFSSKISKIELEKIGSL